MTETTISVHTQAQADAVQRIFQKKKQQGRVNAIACEKEENNEISLLIQQDMGDWTYRLDAEGEILTAGFFGGGIEDWFN